MRQRLPILLFFFLAVGLLWATPAVAQTVHTTPKQQKKEVRNSLKEAKQVTSDYNESHLDVSAYNFQKGETGRKLKKTKKKNEMPINGDGTAVVKTKLFSKKNAVARVRRD